MDVLCIGIGNDYRQDDSLGLRVAEALRARCLPGVQVSTHSREGISLVNAWENVEAVILIDAVSSGAEPGLIYEFLAHEQPLPEEYFPCSTHSISIGEAVELARSLNQLPSRCIFFGIEGASFEPGMGLSAAAEKAVPLLTDIIQLTIEDLNDAC